MDRTGEFPSDISVARLAEHEALALLSATRSASWRQFPAYASAAAAKAGAESRYLLVRDATRNLAIANVRIKRLPLTRFGLAMIAQGPVMLPAGEGHFNEVLRALADYLVDREGLTLRINLPVDDEVRQDQPDPRFSQIPGTAYETFMIDLRPDEAALRSGLDGKWRTDLRRGERGSVQITRSSHPSDFRRFQPLLLELAQSKGFRAPQDADFFSDVAALAQPPENISLHLAWHQGCLIGGHIGAFSGRMAVYLVGAVNDKGRQLRASFLLQWAAIRYARELGLSCYDLGGIDEVGNPDVYRFKKRMGGVHYRGTPMIEARPAWPNRQIVQLAERLYAHARR